MMNRVTKIAACILLAAISVTLLPGCASTGNGTPKTAVVEISSSGIIRVEGTPVAIDQLGPQLKRKGYSQRSPVDVKFSKPLSERMQKTITMALTRHGFVRVAFRGPKTVSTDVSNVPPGR